ncbi:hypothetical protein FJU08_22405 [Martelella alba]|uniref:Uncharacterized protein n=1 Tax=Martelella alba TaxID=2590451 RepID=A0A506TW93_9HYPH|nr:hypothetical protein [Martelella alba]TPW26342.1 hypothetical protein FJU08_22405 [Martelella alba]
MPTRPPPRGMPIGRPWRTLGDAARDGQIVQIYCGGCRRQVNFLARDLAAIKGDMHYLHEPPFICSRCKTDEYIKISTHSPSDADYGDIRVRRPAGLRQIWKTVKLGDDV